MFKNNYKKSNILVQIEKILRSLFLQLKIFFKKWYFFKFILRSLFLQLKINGIKLYFLLNKRFTNSFFFNYFFKYLILKIEKILYFIKFLRTFTVNIFKKSEQTLTRVIWIFVSGFLIACVVRVVNFFVFPLIQEYFIDKYPRFSLKMLIKMEKVNWKIKHIVNKAQLSSNPYNFYLPYNIYALWGNKYLNWFFQKMFFPMLIHSLLRRL